MSGQLSILVIGLGGIGSIYSLVCKRGEPNAKLTFVARSNYQALHDNGISIKSAKYGHHHVTPDAVFKTTEDAAGVEYDYILCTTKSLPNAPLPALLRPVVSPNTTIVMIQNGLGIEQPVAEAFPENALLTCTAYIGVWQTSPGNIEHAKLDKLDIGIFADAHVAESRKQKDTAALDKFVSVLKAGGTDVTVLENMVLARWQKLVWNASFNVVCTVMGMDTFQVLACPSATTLVRTLMEEICAAAKANGYELPAGIIQGNLDNTHTIGPYKPSMLLDYEGGREMEVDVILGNPIAQAQQAGVAVPTLQVMKETLECLNWKTAEKKK
ncbi:ketopantoate reductase PanE/ApbA-domain-containing protein [Protomyces lactucae-debilis]|uniref:2-dehydropantoate 2-reductase n=1 Tax=Protomyces lactucae-debilis TaxID=2754530 RepID=A0A1Y2FAI4_PROLT|nr:ketopantoate reductase PanE/ApbA-domain-containing protein [Protomyces lactucae-debilis]ORY80893.1 ketopantoate reductase PanE/ApbA-domain-containing protein [Protomyces lactucae-debilis]